MIGKTRERLHQGVYELLTQFHGRPFLQYAQVQHMFDDRKTGPGIGAYIDIG